MASSLFTSLILFYSFSQTVAHSNLRKSQTSPHNLTNSDTVADTRTVLKFSQWLEDHSTHEAKGEQKTLFEDAKEYLGQQQVPTDKENPKCDQACSTGSVEDRQRCAVQCAKLQKKICVDGFTCRSGCGNDEKLLKKDPECEELCDSVHSAVCYPFQYEASKKDVSPHHDDKPPPSIEATPAPRIFTGRMHFCNLYPSNRPFEVFVMAHPTDNVGDAVARLSYKQCDEISVKTGDYIGLKTGGVMSGVSKPILKIPSIMLFGQWAHGNHQVNFNRFYVKSGGPFVCNGFPIWEKNDDNVGAEVQLFRDGKVPLAKLRYKECTATSVHDGEEISAAIGGKEAGAYKIVGSPQVIVLGKAGETTALAYEAWAVGDLHKDK